MCTLGEVLKAAGSVAGNLRYFHLGNIIQFVFILRPRFPTWLPRNPSVAHNIIRSSARNSGINEHRFWNTATSSRYRTKYRGKFCPSIGNSGVIPVRCQLRQFFFGQFRVKVAFSSILSVSLLINRQPHYL